MRRKIYTLVNNARITFAEAGSAGELRTVASADINDFIDGAGVDEITSKLKGDGNELLVVPDFWMGVKSYLISSGKRSVVELFIRRKLRADEPDIPEVEDFFDYVNVRDEQGREGVHVYHLQEALFARLYHRLAGCGLCPKRVSTPGLLWEGKLAGLYPDFADVATFLVHLVGSECFFYFFHRGRYIFSRDISISEHLPIEERIDALSFEIDQSRFLFSQKAKAEIDRICLSSSGQPPLPAGQLAERLGRDFEILGADAAPTPLAQAEELYALLHFSTKDLAYSVHQLNLTHRRIRKESEWRPVQMSGLAVGIVLLLILLGQAFFLQWWPATEWQQLDSGKQVEVRQALRNYNANLDLLLQESRRPVFADALARLALALPANMRLTQLTIESQPQAALELRALVAAADAEQFKQTLTLLAEQLKAEFGPAFSLDPRDIEFESSPDEGLTSGGQYNIQFRCNLQ